MARVALVTGGTRGIGAAVSKALKAAGYSVAAVYHGNDAAAQKFKAETGIAVYKWDVASFDACAAGVKQVEAEVGPIDVLVNNAGITRDGQLHRMKPEQWTEVINTNLGSLFNMTRQVIEGMRARKFGRVINISSINGQKGQFGQCNYSAAKAGELGFTKALAQESARSGITVTDFSSMLSHPNLYWPRLVTVDRPDLFDRPTRVRAELEAPRFRRVIRRTDPGCRLRA